MSGVLVGIGGFFGAMLRLFVSQLAKQYTKTTIPYGTVFVNLLGSFALGLLFALVASASFYLLFGIGFLGAFTTFSTYQVELVQMIERRKWAPFIMYFLLGYGGGVLLALAGYYIGG